METLHTFILVLHVLGAAIIIGVAFVSFIVEVKEFASQQVNQLVSYIWKIAGIALGIQVLTGLYLAFSEWDKIGRLPYFWIKMVLVFGIGGVVGIMSHRRVRLKNERRSGKIDMFKWTLLSLLIFLSVAMLGVMIAESAT